MSARPTILICDDDPERAAGWQRQIESLPEVATAFRVEHTAHLQQTEGVSLAAIVAALEERRAEARETGHAREAFPADAANCFDRAAILIVDYDLLGLPDDGAPASHLTGERVAYLARCYSRCGLIVALNQFAKDQPTFDLTLTDRPRSFADLNIASGEVHNRGLWSADRAHWEDYRPWAWPVLPLALTAFEHRAEALRPHLDDEPIVQYLGIPGSIADALPRPVVEFLTGGDDLQRITFRQFTRQPEVALKPKDEPYSEEATARIAAARIGHWLERLVLPAQDVLVDAPHLVARYPSRLRGEQADVEAWNATASFALHDGLPVKDEPFEGARFRRADWLSRAAWFWKDVSECSDIEEVARPWETSRPEFVFAEDTSRFIGHEEASVFVADVTSPFARRYARRFEDGSVAYRPRVRFSL